MRKINEIIVHCSAKLDTKPDGTKTYYFPTTAEIKWYHININGWKDIGYHWVVELDASIHKGRPESQVGAHVSGHNDNTIGVCYVGGVTAEPDAAGAALDTRTPEQKIALEKLLKDILKRYPRITKITGHNQYAAKACPSFDAESEYAYLLPKPNMLSRAVNTVRDWMGW